MHPKLFKKRLRALDFYNQYSINQLQALMTAYEKGEILYKRKGGENQYEVSKKNAKQKK